MKACCGSALIKGATVLAAWLVGSAIAGAVVMNNPGFETGDFTGWTTFGAGWRISSGADAHSGTYGVVDDVLAGDGAGFRGLFQNVALDDPQRPLTAGVWLRTVALDGPPDTNSQSWLELQFYDVNANLLSQHQSAHVTVGQPFTLLSLANIPPPANAVTVGVRAIVQLLDVQPAENADFHIFDDFSLVAVPEPSTAVLLLGGAMLLRRFGRRNRA